MRAASLALLLCGVISAATAKLTYIRSFPASDPPYFAITVDESGQLDYRESPTDPKPLQAHVAAEETAPLFAMAAEMNYFKTPLESGLKVANTGKKIFRYQDASGKVSETAFNYSTNESAQHLLEKFEQIAASERAYLELDRTIHFDKLGVNDALAEIESLWLRKQLTAPDQFVPLLTRVATHESFMHLARARAAHLKEEFAASAAVAPSDPN